MSKRITGRREGRCEALKIKPFALKMNIYELSLDVVGGAYATE